MTVDASAVALVVVTAAAAATRFVPSGHHEDKALNACEAAYLRGGPRAAAQTSLVELQLLGSVQATGDGRVARTSVAPATASRLARAQFGTLYSPTHPLLLQAKPRVQEALGELSLGLQRSGLLLTSRRYLCLRLLLVLIPFLAVVQLGLEGTSPGSALLFGVSLTVDAVLWLLPRRTPRGTIALRRLRRDLGEAPDSTVMAVALSGAPALRTRLPRFTEDGGLLTKPSADAYGKVTIESRDDSTLFRNLGGPF